DGDPARVRAGSMAVTRSRQAPATLEQGRRVPGAGPLVLRWLAACRARLVPLGGDRACSYGGGGGAAVCAVVQPAVATRQHAHNETCQAPYFYARRPASRSA